jgi:competence protein ComEC
VSDRLVVALAVAVVVGALIAHALPLWMCAVMAGGAWLWRRPLLVVVGAALLASSLGALALAGLDAPPRRALHDQWLTLLTDPAPNAFGSTAVDVRIGRRHAQAFARGTAATALSAHLAGERVRVSGRLEPVTGVARERLVPRHIAARLSIDEVTAAAPANALGAAANAYRRVVARGAEALPERLRPLFGGMVLGDDRGQSVELQDAFRAAGLTHLMVVSGQNVAFALLVAAPLLRRGRLWWRFAITVAVLLAFGTLTRWEPSVLRAEAMAVVAAAGALVGRPVPAVRLLALAVAGCVLVDPLLVRSVGFRLSVAACAGLVVLTPPLLRRRVPTLVAASIGAQVGAALVLVPTFGAVPVISLPANVLAVPVAGPLMMWGLTAGPLAGLAAPLAAAVHFPTRLALSWVAGVATRAASAPIAQLGAAAMVLVVTGGVALVAKRCGVRVVGALLVLAVVGSSLRGPSPVVDIAVEPGVRLWVIDGRSVVSVGGRLSPRTLDALRRRRVHRLDLLVVTKPGAGAAAAAWPLIAAFSPRVVLAPEHHQVAGARTARRGAVAVIGDLAVEVVDAGPPLQIEVRRTGYGQPP